MQADQYAPESSRPKKSYSEFASVSVSVHRALYVYNVHVRRIWNNLFLLTTTAMRQFKQKCQRAGLTRRPRAAETRNRRLFVHTNFKLFYTMRSTMITILFENSNEIGLTKKIN